VQVGEHKVIVFFIHQIYGLVTTRRSVNDVAFILKDRGCSDAQAFLVVHDKQSRSLGKRNKAAHLIAGSAVS
jgi:hypothetical protein